MDGLVQRAFPEFLDAIPDAVVGADETGIIRFVNVQAERVFGYDHDELLGRDVETLVPQRHRDAHVHHRALYALDPVKRPMGQGLQLTGLKKDGTEFPCDISLSTVHLDEKPLMLAAVRDMTDRKRYEALFVTQLTGNVAELTQSVKDLVLLFEAEKKGRTRQRRRDLAIGAAVALIIAVGGYVQIGNQERQNRNSTTICTAVNEANKTLHDLFTPFLQPQVRPTFEAMTPEEKARTRAQNVQAAQGLQAFTDELNRRTAQKTCP